MRDEPRLRKLQKKSYKVKKFLDPVAEEIDLALLEEFDRMPIAVATLTNYALIYRVKLFAAERFNHLPADKLHGFSKR
ncbi:hypothetical protein ON010_g8656 [Phytophthora cinnamomi]|nr:hypothetical protein ON010_g8656 [Phytophthora cinnamomi]